MAVDSSKMVDICSDLLVLFEILRAISNQNPPEPPASVHADSSSYLETNWMREKQRMVCALLLCVVQKNV